MRKTTLFFTLLFALLLGARLCHVHILWEGDDYPLAAAQQLEHGKVLYRDIWFDKPPLLPLLYLTFGAMAGWPLRVAGALYALLACWLAYAFARDQWSEREGLWAAGLLGFFLVFDIPSSVIPVASDLLMVAPHLAAVWLASRRKPFWAGAVAAIAFWISPKGVFVGMACLLFDPAGVLWMAAGFLTVSGMMVGGLAGFGALGAYWEEVWKWGRLYAASPFVDSPWHNGLLRTVNWVGFHIAAVAAAAVFYWKTPRKAWIGWLILSFMGVAAGLRFFPRYYFLLLPVVVMAAARGFTLIGRRRELVALLLLIPATRFGPAYLTAVRDPLWRDTAMDRDSRHAADLLRPRERSGDTLLVWGYRPEMYVYADLPAATMYIDTQPLSGVPADRHLTSSESLERQECARRRAEIVKSTPSFILDGLGIYNPRLALTAYPELAAWLAHYREIGRTSGTILYQKID
ncbi:MAG TPA: hypothetical protein VG456_10530 [Candidatus Sulfopaludibacter sp.]|nr:hypothetical protein [Candidatus Sulfopaludibacter sp.]